MSHFSARVQLPGYPTSENYTRLHQLMATTGFLRTITASDGSVWALPHGEYAATLYETDPHVVRNQVQAATRAYFLTAEIIVTMGISAWVNLKLTTSTTNALADALGLKR